MLVRACTISLALAPARSLLLTANFSLRRALTSTARITMSAAGEAVSSEERSTPSASDALSFLRVVGKLKGLKRTGWVHCGVSQPESVSDHMYRMAMCSFLVTDPKLDRSRILKLAVVHDLAEALAGDIAPFQNVSKEDKRRLEEDGLEKICSTIGSEPIAQEIKELWVEYEDCTSEEARVVKDFDKLEMIVQADEYERDQGMDLSGFFESTEGGFTTPQVQSWDKELRAQRNNRQQESTPTPDCGTGASEGAA
ncbi:unnamed protein product [Laminaria digitata]